MNMLFTLRQPHGFWPMAVLLVVLAVWTPGRCSAQSPQGSAPDESLPDSKDEKCTIDLRLPGQMRDVLANVLSRVAGISNDKVDAFLLDAENRFESGDDMMRAAASHFGIDETKFAAEVQRMKHINCSHGPIPAENGRIENIPDEANNDNAFFELTDFARDVTLHVVLHEMGHALIREFDIPILANEETMADAFATWYLTAHLPERAPDVILARVRSLMIEAGEVPREKWPVNGEHNSDARRAYQIAAIAIAADRNRYRPVADAAGMSESDIRKAADYGAEIHRSWRRIVQPLMMPSGQLSREAGLDTEQIGDAAVFQSYESLLTEMEIALRGFDWHSYVKIQFVQGDGGAAWSRSSRTIAVHSAYLQRFIQQGRQADLMSAGKSPASEPDSTGR